MGNLTKMLRQAYKQIKGKDVYGKKGPVVISEEPYDYRKPLSGAASAMSRKDKYLSMYRNGQLTKEDLKVLLDDIDETLEPMELVN